MLRYIDLQKWHLQKWCLEKWQLEKWQLQKKLVFAFTSCLIMIVSWVFTPTAEALTQIKLSKLSYQECPPELAKGQVTSGTSMSANCFLVTGKAYNPSSKKVYDADIFGRVYDANNNPVMQNRNRLGSITELPPGESDFQIRISVASNQPTPLKLKKFKASGFSSPVR